MDKRVNVRFYQVSRHSPQDMLFSECLEEIFQNRQGQWIDADGAEIRLERFSRTGNIIEGELTRRQTENIPPKALGRRPLEPNNDPIAHRAAFRYDRSVDILAMEVNRNGISPNRFNQIIAEVLQHPGFLFLPALTNNAWQRFANCVPKSISIKVARPENLRPIDNPTSRTITRSLQSMQDALGGPNVEITVGWGRGHGMLNIDALTQLVRGIMQQQHEGADVKKLKIKAEGEDELIDLLGGQMRGRRVLDLNNDDLEAHYAARRDFIREAFRRYTPMIRELYGRAA